MVSRSVALGEILRAHGIKGEVRIRLYNPDSSMLGTATTLTLRSAKGDCRQVTVGQVRVVPGGALVKLHGVDDRTQAELLRGSVLEMKRDELPPTEEGEYYACDLVGARVLGPTGALGIVRAVATYPTTDVLVIERQAGKGTIEIPLLDDFVERVDIQEGVVIVRAEALAFSET